MEEPAGPSRRERDEIDVDDIEEVPSGSDDNANEGANSQDRNPSNTDDLPPIGSGKLSANISWAYSLNYYRRSDDDTAICRLCEQESKKKFKKNIQTHFKTTNFGTSGNGYKTYFSFSRL